ncbi:MAG: alpha/beta fold hydrolase [Polyangiaceae bacterium]|nr:alpha/beta fold hydrolase [Polyangiaceae bacterium]
MIEREVELPGGRFVVLEHGPPAGPVVLCVHGFPDIPQTWGPLAERLAAGGYRVVAPYLRGYAPSTLAGPFHLRRIAQDLLELADALSPRSPVLLVGHDWGAAAAFVALAIAPSRFARAVTLAVPHPLAFRAGVARHPRQLARSWYMAFFQLPAVPEAALRGHDFALVERLWRAWSPGWRPPVDHLARVKRCLAESLPGPVDYYRALLASARDTALARAAARLEVPVLHVHGRTDGCVGVELAREQARYFGPRFRWVEVDGVGHFLHLEAPDRVGALVEEGLRA